MVAVLMKSIENILEVMEFLQATKLPQRKARENQYSNSALMIDVYSLTRNEEGFSKKIYHFDTFHLDRRALSSIGKQLN